MIDWKFSAKKMSTLCGFTEKSSSSAASSDLMFNTQRIESVIGRKKVVIIAGEASGDIHAAEFVRNLKQQHTQLQFSGIGGQHMQAAGVELISDLAQYGVTGFSEVFRHMRVIRQAFIAIKRHLQEQTPDLLILVDYPGFNLRLARFAKKTLGIPILYYISPQIWAWKGGRIHQIREYVDRMAVILPFEKKIYVDAHVPVNYVGHPLVSKIITHQDVEVLKTMLGLPHQKRLIALLPGSRVNEIERLMPVLCDSAEQISQRHSDVHFVIPIAKTIRREKIEAYLKSTKLSCTLVDSKALEVMYCSDVTVVASGTASLECALLAKPMCIVYKTSWLTYVAGFKLIRVKFLGLCNLLKNQMIVPELLQYDCNAHELTRTISELLSDTTTIERMKHRLQQMREELSIEQADLSIDKLIQLMLFHSEKADCCESIR